MNDRKGTRFSIHPDSSKEKKKDAHFLRGKEVLLSAEGSLWEMMGCRKKEQWGPKYPGKSPSQDYFITQPFPSCVVRPHSSCFKVGCAPLLYTHLYTKDLGPDSTKHLCTYLNWDGIIMCFNSFLNCGLDIAASPYTVLPFGVQHAAGLQGQALIRGVWN